MNLQTRVVNILTKPKEEWPVIAGEAATVGGIFSGYVVPLAAIAPICTFIGMSVFGVTMPFFGTYRPSVGHNLTTAVLSYVFGLIGVYLAAFIVQKLAPTFQSEPNFVQALKLVAYACTPSWVAGVLNIIPQLGLLVLLAGLYGIYLFYLGVTPVMKTPKEKVVPYMIVAAIVVIVVTFVMGAITAALTAAFYGAPTFPTM